MSEGLTKREQQLLSGQETKRADKAEAERDDLRARAEQAERERDEYMRQFQREEIAAGYAVSEAEELEAERDALRAEAGRLREALKDGYELPDLTAASWIPWHERAGQVLSSAPLSAAAVGRVRLLERVVEAARKAELNMDDMTATREMRQTFEALRDALAATDRTEEK